MSDCCCLLVVVCGTFNAFRIYLWPLDARNSTIPTSPTTSQYRNASCLLSHVRPRQVSGHFPRNAANTKIPVIQKFIGHLTQIFHTFTKGQFLQPPLSPRLFHSFAEQLSYEWSVLATSCCFVSGSQGPETYYGCSFIWGWIYLYSLLSAKLNKMPFGQLKASCLT